MPRPLIYANDLRELPAHTPLDVGAAKTGTQALTPAQIVGGANVEVAWSNGVLTIHAVGDGGVAAESVADRLARLPAADSAFDAAALSGGGPSPEDSGLRVASAMIEDRTPLDALEWPAASHGTDFAWIMDEGDLTEKVVIAGDGVNTAYDNLPIAGEYLITGDLYNGKPVYRRESSPYGWIIFTGDNSWNVAAGANYSSSRSVSHYVYATSARPPTDAGVWAAWNNGAGGIGEITLVEPLIGKTLFMVSGADAGVWAGAWRVLGRWRGHYIFHHRDDVQRLCHFDPENERWAFGVWPPGSVFPGYPDAWNTRAERSFAEALPDETGLPPSTGYADPEGNPLDVSLDYDFIVLTGDEIVVSGSEHGGLNGAWVAAADRYNGRRHYRRASDGGGVIYYYGDPYGWILYAYGGGPGDGPPDVHSVNWDDTSSPNHPYLAPPESGYTGYYGGSASSTTITVTA